ncbi:9720_t:CDS:2 [Diversispora eburnea]|uniref:9720_t:CDS:1 n=1 Tax=Diversispora eburnea TaxID=1213867 RepID=A0A9N8V3Q8_9GLOM|nr:9720_t:CDS:2 [Diversispora eburnea]
MYTSKQQKQRPELQKVLSEDSEEELDLKFEEEEENSSDTEEPVVFHLSQKSSATNIRTKFSNKPPSTGEEYLNMVKSEANKIPNVFVAKKNIRENVRENIRGGGSLSWANTKTTLIEEQDKQNRENGLVNEEWEKIFLERFENPLSPLGEGFESFGSFGSFGESFGGGNSGGDTGMTITKSQWIFALLIRIDQLLTSNQMVILREMCRKCITIRKNLVIRKDLMKELFTVRLF